VAKGVPLQALGYTGAAGQQWILTYYVVASGHTRKVPGRVASGRPG
jgi:hypothetical protein